MKIIEARLSFLFGIEITLEKAVNRQCTPINADKIWTIDIHLAAQKEKSKFFVTLGIIGAHLRLRRLIAVRFTGDPTTNGG